MQELTELAPEPNQSQNPFAPGCAWIDGNYVPIAEANIPILDSGFVRSDVTYDVVAVWEGAFFRLDDHLDRFLRSCELLRLEPGLSREEMREIVFGVVSRSGLRRAYVEVVLSRGVPRPGDRDPRNWTSRFYAYAIPYMWIVKPDVQAKGTDVVVARDTRRIPIGSFDPRIKNFQWGDFTRAIFEAYDRGAWLPILTDGEGHVTECPGCNVFVVSEGRVLTPARGILEGISRMTAIEIAAALGIDLQVGEIPTSLLYDAEEIFLTSTAGGIIPVATLDGQPVGSGRPGPITNQIREGYWDWHSDPKLNEKVDYPSPAA